MRRECAEPRAREQTRVRAASPQHNRKEGAKRGWFPFFPPQPASKVKDFTHTRHALAPRTFRTYTNVPGACADTLYCYWPSTDYAHEYSAAMTRRQRSSLFAPERTDTNAVAITLGKLGFENQDDAPPLRRQGNEAFRPPEPGDVGNRE